MAGRCKRPVVYSQLRDGGSSCMVFQILKMSAALQNPDHLSSNSWHDSWRSWILIPTNYWWCTESSLIRLSSILLTICLLPRYYFMLLMLHMTIILSKNIVSMCCTFENLSVYLPHDLNITCVIYFANFFVKRLSTFLCAIGPK